MSLSRLAREFADEINGHDWSDAPYRLDRAGHDRATDTKRPERQLGAEEAENVKTNVMWVTAQVLAYADPNFRVDEFAIACGIPRRITHRSDKKISGILAGGLRTRDGHVAPPGSSTAASPTGSGSNP